MQRFNTIIGVTNFVLLTLFVSYYFLGRADLYYIDTNHLLNNYKGMIDAREDFKKKVSVWEANIDTLASEMKKQISAYEADKSKLTRREKSLTEELIRTKQRQLTEYQQAMSAKAQQDDEEMTRRVLDQVNAYIKKYGENKGLKIILAATEYGNIAYAEDKYNITDEILDGLNNAYAPK